MCQYLPGWRWDSVSLDNALILLWLRLTNVGKLLLDWCLSSTTRTALRLNCSSKLSIGVSILYVWFPAISPTDYKSWLSHFNHRHTHCIQLYNTPDTNMARHVCTENRSMRTLGNSDYLRCTTLSREQGSRLKTIRVHSADIWLHNVINYFYFHHAFIFEDIFWDVTLFHWSNSSCRFGKPYCLHLHV